MPLISERIQFDDANDIAIIDGIKVDGAMFGAFTQVTAPGKWFRVRERDQGIVTIVVRHDKTDLDPPTAWLNPATGACMLNASRELMVRDQGDALGFTVRLDERVGNG